MSNRVPQGWSVSQINDTCDVFDFMRVPLNTQERALRKGRYPYYGANGVQGYIDDFIFDGEYVLLAEDGGYFDQWSTRPISYLVTGKFWVNNHAHILKAKAGHETKYIHYSLVHKNILEHINGGTRSKLNQSDMRNIEYLTPPLPEQQKIATILSSVDDVIEKTRAQIDKLKDLKTGMMQELLTKGIGHTEFKDSPVGRIPMGWECKTIKSISLRIWIGLVTSMTKHYVDQGVPLVRNSDIKEFFFKHKGMINLAPEFAESNHGRSFEAGDVITVHTGDVGTSAVVDEKLNGAHGFATINTRVNPNLISPEFLCEMLNSPVLGTQIKKIVTGDGRDNLNLNDFFGLLVPIPSFLSEQKIIHDSINSTRIKINRLVERLDAITSVKKALMQDLLTGKVRVNITDKESAVV